MDLATIPRHLGVGAPATGAAAIHIENVGHRYGMRDALRDVTFDVQKSEIFGLLGPNGSGKTSLFRILTTLMVPTRGRAFVAGAEVSADPDGVRRMIGVVFQQSSVDLKLSVAENLRHQGHLYGLRGRPLQSRIEEMMERVGLSDRADDRLETLSGGMRRRVELAKGLIHRPSVLLLDEPTTGLDPGARRDLWSYLNILRQSEGATILLTTHLMEEAERCDRLAILNEGTLVALGTPTELKAEIGGDVVLLETADAAELASAIQQRFGVAATVLGEQQVRLEIANGHRFVAGVAEAFGKEITSVTVSRPTLEDVFIDRTGHRFWTERQEEEFAE
jgi:ABC-2 type transport system ATP-binding protein